MMRSIKNQIQMMGHRIINCALAQNIVKMPRGLTHASDICAERRPANALLIWTDGRSIYVELPSKANVPPCIITYRLSEGGLSKALSLLGKHATLPEPRKSLSQSAEPRTMLAPSHNMPLLNPSCERRGYKMMKDFDRHYNRSTSKHARILESRKQQKIK